MLSGRHSHLRLCAQRRSLTAIKFVLVPAMPSWDPWSAPHRWCATCIHLVTYNRTRPACLVLIIQFVRQRNLPGMYTGLTNGDHPLANTEETIKTSTSSRVVEMHDVWFHRAMCWTTFS